MSKEPDFLDFLNQQPDANEQKRVAKKAAQDRTYRMYLGDSTPNQQPLAPEYSRWKTGLTATIGVTAILAVGVYGIGKGNVEGWWDHMFHNSSSSSIAEGTKGKVKSITTKISAEPVTYALDDMKPVSASFQKTQEVLGLFSFNYDQQSVENDELVNETVQLKKQAVTISYGRSADGKPHLYEIIPNGALETKMSIDKQSTIDDKGSPTAAISEGSHNLAGAIAGLGLAKGSKEVAVFGKMAAGEITIDDGLNQFAQDYAEVEASEKCTPAIEKVTNYTNDLKVRIRQALVQSVFSAGGADNAKVKDLGDFDKLSVAQAIEIEQNAIVELPKNYTIANDPTAESNIKKDEKLFNTGNVPAATCGVEKGVALPKEGSTATATPTPVPTGAPN